MVHEMNTIDQHASGDVDWLYIILVIEAVAQDPGQFPVALVIKGPEIRNL